MKPTIVLLSETKLIGRKILMSYSDDQTRALWKSFMPLRKNIGNVAGSDLYSVEVYHDAGFFEHFNPEKQFEKWAAVKVEDHHTVPDGMAPLILPEGRYAVFLFKGKSGDAEETYRYIYNQWIPASSWVLDDRPHFALMGDKYKHEDPDSEEEIWIPVKHKG